MYARTKNQQSDVLAVILFDRFSRNGTKTKKQLKNNMVRESVCVCVCHVHMCVSVQDWEGSCMFASTAVVD